METRSGFSLPCLVLLVLLLLLGGGGEAPLSCMSRRTKRPKQCKVSSYLVGVGHSCNTENDSECCVTGELYPQYHCSPPVRESHGGGVGRTPAILTLNSFAAGGDGGGPSECDSSYHSDSEMVVALSTGWYSKGRRCGHRILITAATDGGASPKTVTAKVVDECDSVNGCDAVHDYQPPCPYNVVDASPAVWSALGIPSSDPSYGLINITWSDVP